MSDNLADSQILCRDGEATKICPASATNKNSNNISVLNAELVKITAISDCDLGF